MNVAVTFYKLSGTPSGEGFGNGEWKRVSHDRKLRDLGVIFSMFEYHDKISLPKGLKIDREIYIVLEIDGQHIVYPEDNELTCRAISKWIVEGMDFWKLGRKTVATPVSTPVSAPVEVDRMVVDGAQGPKMPSPVMSSWRYPLALVGASLAASIVCGAVTAAYYEPNDPHNEIYLMDDDEKPVDFRSK